MRTYRADIQGLRGIAVLMVLLFHAGIPLGGFLGVDLFFVISGFVVGSILLKEVSETGEIKLRRFFARRFWRLFPALAVMVSVVFITTLIFFWSDRDYGLPVVAASALFFVSNVALPVIAGDYFAADTKMSPLLHTWSLGVEEQFYIFIAVSIFFLSKIIGRKLGNKIRTIRIFVILASLGSLALAVLGSSELLGALPFGQAVIGFYSPVSRIWEFGAGLLIVSLPRTLFKNPGNKELNGVFRVAGLALVIISALLFSADVRHPGLLTLIPVAGVALVIISGSEGDGRLLRGRLITKIGDMSYSLYLWHWPLVVFLERALPDFAQAGILAVSISIPVAYFSHKYLEAPFRGEQYLAKRIQRVNNFSIVFTLVVTFIGLAGFFNWNPEFRVLKGHDFSGPDEPYFLTASRDFGICSHPETGERGEANGKYHGCLSSDERQSPKIVIIGDSHAAHLFTGVAQNFPDSTVSFWDLSSAVWQDEERPTLIELAGRSDTIEIVIINYRWQGYNPTVLNENFREALKFLVEKNKLVVLTNGGPTFPFDPDVCRYGRGVFSIFPVCLDARSSQEATFNDINQAVSAISSGLVDVVVANTQKAFCSELVCRINKGETVLFDDPHHLNVFGSSIAAEEVLVAIHGEGR